MNLCDDHEWVGDGECPRCVVDHESYRQMVQPRALDIALNTKGTVVIDRAYKWNRDMTQCPRGAKVQLLGAGGVAHYGIYKGDPFWVGWAPVPTN